MLSKIIRGLSLLVLVVVCMLFGAENRETISLTLFDFETWELAIFVWLIAALGLGLLLGYVFAIAGRLGRPVENKPKDK
jgi:hypothetical protein